MLISSSNHFNCKAVARILLGEVHFPERSEVALNIIKIIFEQKGEGAVHPDPLRWGSPRAPSAPPGYGPAQLLMNVYY